MTWIHTGYRKGSRGLIVLLVALLGLHFAEPAGNAQANVVKVSAASDMEPVFEVVGPIFERKTGLKLKVSFGSSATLSQQLQNGLQSDIFFSADYHFAEQVAVLNLAESKQPTPYAEGLLVLWTRNDSRFKPLSVDVLARQDLKSVAVANQDRAPYGRAAYAALKKMHFFPNVELHLVQAETVAQAAQFALSGNAELALVSETIAMSPKYRDVGNFVRFPLSQYAPIHQCAVILKAATNRDGAHKLLTFMLSDEVQDNLPKLGLQATK